jgi:hypothetical protein
MSPHRRRWDVFLFVDFIFNLRVAGGDQVSGRTQPKTDDSAMGENEKGNW